MEVSMSHVQFQPATESELLVKAEIRRYFKVVVLMDIFGGLIIPPSPVVIGPDLNSLILLSETQAEWENAEIKYA